MKSSRTAGRAACCLAASLFPSILAAQAPAGTVTGHITCADTQRPARFAGILLLGVPKEATPPPEPTAPPDTAQMKAAMNAALSGLNMVQTQSDLEGVFTISDVAPGDYYVFASIPGYVQPAALAQAAQDAGADLIKSIPGVPIVHVVAGRTSQSDISIPRGGAVSGHVVWDDGSPVTRAIITMEAQKTSGKKLPSQLAMLGLAGGLGGGGVLSITDDLGQFRIAGLAPGSYSVKATLQVHQQVAMQGGVMSLNSFASDKPVVIYAPAALHKADAQIFSLKAGDEQHDALITIDLSSMRSVKGRVSSAVDRHGINSATVTLTDATDKTLVRSAGVDNNGNFAILFVPSGTWNLTVDDAQDTTPAPKKKTGIIGFQQEHIVRSYETGKQTVIVAGRDVTDQDIELTPSRTAKKDQDFNDLMEP